MLRKIASYLSFRDEIEDFDEIHATIEQGINFRGTNLWILVFAIIVACVGLNMNSIPFVIGAMLISPLMGPINGMGYSIAINDFTLFRRSLKNFIFAILASIIASTLYFALTPVSYATSELLARTSPSIYDVLVAIFGGLAGMVAISSCKKGNVIPGVAIATTLMPPLCTAGFGLATGQFMFFFGALYLFAINSVCIAISATFVSQFLKFPIRRNISEERKTKINRIISLVLIITIIPSIYLGYKLIQNETFNTNAQEFIKSVGVIKDNYLLKSHINSQQREISLTYAGMSLTEEDKEMLREKSKSFSLNNAHLEIEQGFSFEPYLADESTHDSEESLKAEINRLNLIIKNDNAEKDSLLSRLEKGKQLLLEINPLFPSIRGCSYGEIAGYNEDDSVSVKKEIIIFTFTDRLSAPEKKKINEWLRKRLNTEEIKVYYEEIKADK